MRYFVTRAFWDYCYDQRVSMRQLSIYSGLGAVSIQRTRLDPLRTVSQAFVDAVTYELALPADGAWFVPVETTEIRVKEGDLLHAQE